MAFFMANLSTPAFAAAMVITLFAGFVKGAVGFAMPMIMISGFSSFLPPETALAGLILPTLVTNLSQAFRQGWQPALQTVHTYRRILIATVMQRQGMARGQRVERIEGGDMEQRLPQAAGGMERHVPRDADALGQGSEPCRRTTRGRAGGAADQQGECTAQGRGKRVGIVSIPVAGNQRAPVPQHPGQGHGHPTGRIPDGNEEQAEVPQQDHRQGHPEAGCQHHLLGGSIGARAGGGGAGGIGGGRGGGSHGRSWVAQPGTT
jgi:hypothetical protein